MQWANWPSPIEAEIAVAGNPEIDKIAVGEVGAGQHRRHAAMHAVEAVRLAEEVGRRLRRTTDPGKLGDLVRRQAQLKAGLNNRGADRIVPASGAQGRNRTLVIATGVAERVGRQLRVVQAGLGDIGHADLKSQKGNRRPRESGGPGAGASICGPGFPLSAGMTGKSGVTAAPDAAGRGSRHRAYRRSP